MMNYLQLSLTILIFQQSFGFMVKPGKRSVNYATAVSNENNNGKNVYERSAISVSLRKTFARWLQRLEKSRGRCILHNWLQKSGKNNVHNTTDSCKKETYSLKLSK